MRRLEVGGKVACWSTKAAISLRRVKIEEKLLWRAYRVFQKTDPLVYFDDNFGKYGPILIIFFTVTTRNS